GTESNHDIMIDSFRHLFTFLPTALANRTYLRPKLGKPFFDHLSSIVPGKGARAREFKRFRTLDPPPNRALVERALATLHRTLPAFKDVRVERSWAGYIDFTPDFIPVIDKLDRPAGLILATGMSGHGFGMGPIVGRLVSELIVDGKASLDVSGFRFGRFADGTLGPPKNVL
ncbi:MAG: NAD(P)/FAD-dependent oxidoreductase, partial [Alphaproteobacteria bacterium]